MYIDFYSYSQRRQQRLSDLKEIFFLSARRELKNDDEREQFYNAWVQPYVENWPDDILFVCQLKTHKTMGYLTGCPNSFQGLDIISKKIKSYTMFDFLFRDYPAHLHINCHPAFRGQGCGTFLLLEYLLELKKKKIGGAHVITSPDEKNVSFYTRNGFTYTMQKEFNNHQLLFMGKKL